MVGVKLLRFFKFLMPDNMNFNVNLTTCLDIVIGQKSLHNLNICAILTNMNI